MLQQGCQNNFCSDWSDLCSASYRLLLCQSTKKEAHATRDIVNAAKFSILAELTFCLAAILRVATLRAATGAAAHTAIAK